MTSGNKLEKSIWPVFLAWSAIGLVSIFIRADANTINQFTSVPEMRLFFRTCLEWGDFIFHLLAAANLLFAVSHYLGWRKTWISFLVISLISGLVETIGARTGFPFGSYFYTNRMGPMLGETLPIAIPLAWWNIISSFSLMTRHVLPRINSRLTSLIVAAFATALDWIMEPFAWKIRGYWIWESGSIPLQNYLAWFALSFILCRVTLLYQPTRPVLDKRVIAVPLLMLSFFISARLLHGI